MNRGMEILSPATYLQNTSWLFDESKKAKWTHEENKRFETALALFDKDTPDRWYNVAEMIPGKTINDVIKHYNELVQDVGDIEAGLVPIPGCTNNSFTLEWENNRGYDQLNQFYDTGENWGLSTRSSDPVRKKGVPWTEEEHRQFLLGLKKYGKGDWRNISRNFVTTRTPTQVASHAQKYFIRQVSGGKDKRRSSIHDITTANFTETKSPSPEMKRSLSPENSSSVVQQQHHSNMNSIANALYSYRHQNYGPDTAIGTQNHGFQLGQYNMFLQMQSTHHRGERLI